MDQSSASWFQDDRMNNRLLDLLKSRRERPVVLAHRGDSYHAPENTLEAARLAWDTGADAWELDVQLTRDGVAVVIHDETLTRTTDVAVRFPTDPRGCHGFRLSDFDWNEVRDLDAGSWFVDENGETRSARDFGTLETIGGDRRNLYRSGAIHVPTLVDCLRLTADLDWLVNVEIKSFPQDLSNLIEAVLNAVEQTGMASQVLLSSFDHRDIARVSHLLGGAARDLRPIALGVLVATPLARPHEYLPPIVRADTYHVSADCLGAGSISYRDRRDARALRVAEIGELKAHGAPLLVYTVNEHGPGSLASHLAELGIDGLFTDDPGGMIRSFT
jgi:glycerophosphoryl diester phosphodiesterase